MTETEELRRLLDGRGVGWRDEYNGFEYITAWHANGIYANFSEDKGLAEPNLLAVYYEDLTPEQAIVATLGAQERTCHMRLCYEEEDADGFIWPDHYECDACGANVNGIMPYYDTEIPPKFCPNCGAKVVYE